MNESEFWLITFVLLVVLSLVAAWAFNLRASNAQKLAHIAQLNQRIAEMSDENHQIWQRIEGEKELQLKLRCMRLYINQAEEAILQQAIQEAAALQVKAQRLQYEQAIENARRSQQMAGYQQAMGNHYGMGLAAMGTSYANQASILHALAMQNIQGN